MKLQVKVNGKTTILEGFLGEDCWILCEECQQPIKQNGVVAFDEPDGDPVTVKPHFFHKEHGDPQQFDNWENLDMFLKHLLDCLS